MGLSRRADTQVRPYIRTETSGTRSTSKQFEFELFGCLLLHRIAQPIQRRSPILLHLRGAFRIGQLAVLKCHLALVGAFSIEANFETGFSVLPGHAQRLVFGCFAHDQTILMQPLPARLLICKSFVEPGQRSVDSTTGADLIALRFFMLLAQTTLLLISDS